jgi:hypothetical protein
MLQLVKKALAVLLVTGSLGVGGYVLAQSTGAPPTAPPKPATPPVAPAPNVPPARPPSPGSIAAPAPPPANGLPPKADVNVPMRVRANISVADMTQQGNEYLAKMNDIVKRMVQLQEIARRQKDVIRLNCVNDKLLQLKQLQNIADQARNNMQEAIARGDEDSRYHEFGRITIAYQQGQVLSNEADNCIGEDLTFLGQTTITVEEPNVPEDPTLQQGPDFPIVQPLPVASPQS